MKMIPTCWQVSVLAVLAAFVTPVRAELPPGAYTFSKRNAKEVLHLAIIKVSRTDGDDESGSYRCQARVTKVDRSARGYRKGSRITFDTWHITPAYAAKRFVGPAIPPKMHVGWSGRVFLNPRKLDPQGKVVDDADVLKLAAYGRSFETNRREDRRQLRSQLQSLLQAVSTGKQKKASQMMVACLLSDPNAYLQEILGDGFVEDTKQMNNTYRKYAEFMSTERAVNELASILSDDSGRTQIQIKDIVTNPNPQHWHNQWLSVTRHRVQLYEVRLVNPKDTKSFFDFGVYCVIDGQMSFFWQGAVPAFLSKRIHTFPQTTQGDGA